MVPIENGHGSIVGHLVGAPSFLVTSMVLTI
jgi:hypothetical protein